MNFSRGAALLLTGVLVLGGCGQPESRPMRVTTEVDPAGVWQFQESGVTASLRGLHVVSARVAFASGSNGTCLRTVDGGQTWQNISPRGFSAADFRDVHATDADSAWLLAAGRPAWVLLTRDGGATWTTCYYDNRPGVFFDSMAFFEDGSGIAFGDPIDGRIQLITTSSGRYWERLDDVNCPVVSNEQVGFAASGTSICTRGDNVWIGLGGSESAVIFHSGDRGRTWRTLDSHLARGTESRGVYSIAFAGDERGVAVGGDHQNHNVTEDTASMTYDGGGGWLPCSISPRGYRSCVAWLGHELEFVAVGPNGTDYTADGGDTWRGISDIGFHAVGFSGPDVGFAVGSDGRIGRWLVKTARDHHGS